MPHPWHSTLLALTHGTVLCCKAMSIQDPTPISPAERHSWASATGLSDAYLYQCLTDRREMDPEQAVKLEKVSEGRVRRWHVRRRSWARIWPELIGTEGAPPIPQPEEASHAA